MSFNTTILKPPFLIASPKRMQSVHRNFSCSRDPQQNANQKAACTHNNLPDCIPSLIFRSQSPSIPTSKAAESSPSPPNSCNARYVGGEAQCIFPLGRFSTNACDRINLYRAVHRYAGSLARSGMCCLRYQLLKSSSERAAGVNGSRRRWFPCLGPFGAGWVVSDAAWWGCLYVLRT
jgi:hypothetical protein